MAAHAKKQVDTVLDIHLAIGKPVFGTENGSAPSNLFLGNADGRLRLRECTRHDYDAIPL